MTTVNERLRNSLWHYHYYPQTKFPLGPPLSPQKQVTNLRSLSLLTELGQAFGVQARVCAWRQPSGSPFQIHSPCGEKEQPGGEVAGIIELTVNGRSLSKAGCHHLALGQKETNKWTDEVRDTQRNQWANGFLKQNKTNTTVLSDLCPGPTIGTYHETQAPISCVSPVSTLGQI